jgi:hypothetical protein
MIHLVIVFIILINGFLPFYASAGENKPVSHSPKNYQVQIEGGRLTGELKNVAVKGLLVEFLQTVGFRWVVKAELNDAISISFAQLTVEQCIKKIMRLSHFSYALVLDGEQSPSSTKPIYIKELIIYKNDNIIRFSRTQQKGLARQNIKIEEKPMPEKDVAISSHPKSLSKEKKHRKRPSRKYKVEFEGTSQDLKTFVNELLIENRISPDEYEKIMKSKVGQEE